MFSDRPFNQKSHFLTGHFQAKLAINKNPLTKMLQINVF